MGVKIRKAGKRQSVLDRQSIKSRKKRDYLTPFKLLYKLGFGVLKVVLVFTVVGIISAGFLFLYQYLLNSPYMKLEEVSIEGVNETIKKEIIDICGLNADLSLLAINLNELKHEMEMHPWIRSVKLQRQFPNTLIVQAEKQTPCALLLTDKLYYMNRWGEIFKEVLETDKTDYPIITGHASENLKKGERLTEAAMVIAALGPERGLWSLDELSEIHLKKNKGISLYFNHIAAEIKLSCSELEEKIEGLRKVSEHLSQTGRIHQVIAIDLSHVDRAVVSFEKG